MNNINEIKLNVLLKILNEEIEKNTSTNISVKEANYLINEIIEICDNDLMTENIKKKILSLALLALPSIMTGCSAEEAQEAAAETFTQNSPAATASTTSNNEKQEDQGVFGAEGEINTERSIQAIENLKNKWDLVTKDLQSVNVDTSPAKKHAVYLSKIYEASSKILRRFDEFKNNKYLMSVFVTSLFASDKGLYQSIGKPISKGGESRTAIVSSKQRYILFYEYVVENKNFEIAQTARTTQLNDAEMEKVTNHPMFDMYSKSIEKIKKTAGSGDITLWLTRDAGYYLKAQEGYKSYWCGAFVGAVYFEAFANDKGEIEGIPMSAFASTLKMIEYAKNKNIAVYSDDFMKKIRASQEQKNIAKSALLKQGMIVLYDFGEGPVHFGIATSSVSSDGTFTAIEGNTGTPGMPGGQTGGDGDASGKPRNIEDVSWIIVPPEYFTSGEARQAAVAIKNMITQGAKLVLTFTRNLDQDPYSLLPQNNR